MAITYTTAEQAAINGTDVSVYTCPSSTVAIISAVVVGNTSGSAVTLTDLKINSNIYVQGKSIPAEGQILTEIEGQTLSAGQAVTISASGGSLNIRLSIKERAA